MKQYSKQQNNMGGLLKLWAIPCEDITLVEPGNLILVRTDRVIELPLQSDSADFVVSAEDLMSGVLHNTEINCTLLADEDSIADILALLAAKKYAVLSLTGNEQYLVFGNQNEHLKARNTKKSGRMTSDLYSCQIVFSAKLTSQPLSVQPVFIA